METIFQIWPTAAELARDVGVPEVTARAWRRRKSIPAHYDITLIGAARARGSDLTLEELAKARADHFQKTKEAQP